MNETDETPKPADVAGRLDGLVSSHCSDCRADDKWACSKLEHNALHCGGISFGEIFPCLCDCHDC